MTNIVRLATLLSLCRQDVQIVLLGHLIELRSSDPYAGGDFQWLRNQHVSIGLTAGGVHQIEFAGPCADVDPLLDHHRSGKGLADSQIPDQLARAGLQPQDPVSALINDERVGTGLIQRDGLGQ